MLWRCLCLVVDGGGVSFYDRDERRILEIQRSNVVFNKLGTPLFVSVMLPLLGDLNLIPRGMIGVSNRIQGMKAFNSGILMVLRCAIVVVHSYTFSYGLREINSNDGNFLLIAHLIHLFLLFHQYFSVTIRHTYHWWM